MKSYQYTALSVPNAIRVLSLERGEDECLKGRLQESNLLTASFSALSYTWGSNEKRFKLEVIGSDQESLGFVPLTENLNSAMNDLLNAKDVKEDRFWIDQVCINQDDIPERNDQVALMGKIYGNAQRVIIYIGPAAIGDTEAVNLLMKIHEHFEPYYDSRQVALRMRGQIIPSHLEFAVNANDPA
jgi:hypothetical protein